MFLLFSLLIAIKTAKIASNRELSPRKYLIDKFQFSKHLLKAADRSSGFIGNFVKSSLPPCHDRQMQLRPSSDGHTLARKLCNEIFCGKKNNVVVSRQQNKTRKRPEKSSFAADSELLSACHSTSYFLLLCLLHGSRRGNFKDPKIILCTHSR